MNIYDTYYNKIESIILSHKDDTKIPSINVYLKNKADFVYGIPMKKTKSIFSKYLDELNMLENNDIFILIDKLMKSKAFEMQIVACMLLERCYYSLNIDLPKIFLDYIENNIIINWAIDDQISLYSLSKLVDKSFVLDYAKHSHYLVRRSAVVTFAEARPYKKDIELLKKTILMLLNEKDEYVLRASGWSLRNIYNYNKKVYFEFFEEYGKYMPRIMLRYGIEQLDENIRLEILYSSKAKRDNLTKFIRM